MYVNGAQVGSADRLGGSITCVDAIVIGGNHAGRYQTCSLGPVRVYYDKALTGAEVTQNYDAERGLTDTWSDLAKNQIPELTSTLSLIHTPGTPRPLFAC